MFRTPEARTALRAAVSAILTGLGAATTALTDGTVSLVEGVTIASLTLGAAGAWYGVGAFTPTEPFVGSGAKVEVPADKVIPVEEP